MPDTIRITRGSMGGCWRRAERAAMAATVSSVTASAAHAAAPSGIGTVQAYMEAIAQLDSHEIVALALTLGILFFAIVTAILLVRTRRRLIEIEQTARDQTLALRTRADRANALLQSEPQVVIAWSTTEEEPEIIGDPAVLTETGDQLLEFNRWLDGEQARAIENAVDALTARGVGFAMTMTTPADRLVEADGQAIGG